MAADVGANDSIAVGIDFGVDSAVGSYKYYPVFG